MKYIEVNYFDVLGTLRNGDTDVFIVDKKRKTINNACTMNVSAFLRILDAADKDITDRYYFYKEEREQGND